MFAEGSECTKRFNMDVHAAPVCGLPWQPPKTHQLEKTRLSYFPTDAKATKNCTNTFISDLASIFPGPYPPRSPPRPPLKPPRSPPRPLKPPRSNPPRCSPPNPPGSVKYGCFLQTSKHTTQSVKTKQIQPRSIGGIPPPSSGLGALHWLHSLRQEKFKFPQLLNQRNSNSLRANGVFWSHSICKAQSKSRLTGLSISSLQLSADLLLLLLPLHPHCLLGNLHPCPLQIHHDPSAL